MRRWLLPEYIEDILPAEAPDNSGGNSVVNNIQTLYLRAVQEANRRPDPRIVEASAEPVTERPQGVNRSSD